MAGWSEWMVGAALATCAPLTAAGSAPAESGQIESLRAFADAFDSAQLAKDGAALERMVADDLVFIDGSGQRRGKRDFIAGWTDPSATFDPIELVDRVIVPLGPDAGIVSAETVLSGVAGGERFSSHFRFSDTFRRIDGEWRAVHIQVTRMPSEPTP